MRNREANCFNSMKFVTLVILLSAVMSLHGVLSQDYDGGGTLEVYMVIMSNLPPTVAYNGSDPNFAATSVLDGQGLDKTDPAVQDYQSHLKATQVDVLVRNNVDPANIVYSYRYAINGFAVVLTADQALLLRQDPDVALVDRQRTFVPTKDASSGKFLRLKRTLWRDSDGVDNAGENVVIGVVDSGIWPEHPSFADDGTYSNISYTKPLWQGICNTTVDFTGCNNKIIGARYYYGGAQASGDLPNTTIDFLSPRDTYGHGTHAAGIAGGNSGVDVTYDGDLKLGKGNVIGKLSGVAPRARIAVYKVFWTSTIRLTPAGTGQTVAYSGDIIAAMDAATADGVDVINYSLSPSGNVNYFDIAALAALYATGAGIFVAASAGNRGPTVATLVNFQPWMMTVGATSDDRFYQNGVSFGSTDAYGNLNAPGFSTGQPLIMGKNASVTGGDPFSADLCFAGTLNATLIADKVVVCTNAAPDLSGYLTQIVAEVKGKGAKGVIVRNMDPAVQAQKYASIPSSFPAVQVSFDTGVQLEAYFNSGVKKPKARIWGAYATFFNEAPCIMDFSSRGPVDNPVQTRLAANANDIFKPDITAPGFNVWGPYSPATGQLFQVESGTSPAAPHVAGMAAIMKQLYPTWSVYAIKSAILTTATTLDNYWNPIGYGSSYQMEPYSASPPVGPFDYGSGFINTDDAPDPGLVYDSTFVDYVAFLYTTNAGLAGSLLKTGNPGVVKRGRDLNLPNLSISNLFGTTTVTRAVTRVGKRLKNALWAVTIQQPAGSTVTINPSTFLLAVNQTITLNITITVTTPPTPPTQFQFGSYTLSNGFYFVRSKIAVQARSV